MVLPKHKIEARLMDENQLIRQGSMRDESPLDISPEFQKLCQACRIGDLKGCQEAIEAGANIQARDAFDYTPLICASLCGHYECVQLLLESGGVCDRGTFQGERCLYNALNDRIRNLLLQYDYSKSTDPYQPFASHITSLLTRHPTKVPNTSDILLNASGHEFNLHKFILSARSPYFHQELAKAPETTIWKLPNMILPQALELVIRYLYLGEIPRDLGLACKDAVSEDAVLEGIEKISRLLKIESLWDSILGNHNKGVIRKQHQDEVSRGRNHIDAWYRNNILKRKFEIETSRVNEVKWTRDNGVFADALLRADQSCQELKSGLATPRTRNTVILGSMTATHTGPFTIPVSLNKSKRSILFPVHRAMLLRSEYFRAMFNSIFREAQPTEFLSVIKVDCTPEVLEIVLDYIYTERVNIPIELALDVLYVADMLLIEKLKTKAAVTISTLGMGNRNLANRSHAEARPDQEADMEPINIYDVIHAAWFLKIQRLEEFSARYLAYSLEDYIDEKDFEGVIKESASRIQKRQETDSIELIDDIRYYLSERFRLRFVDARLDEMMAENTDISAEAAQALPTDEARYAQGLKNGVPLGHCVRTVDGHVAPDEFDADAINYQLLLDKIDHLLEKLKLDA